jgi:hypothetical protein
MYIHSMPVGRTVFEQCFRPMARAMTSIISEGIGPVTGPSVAKLILLDEAKALGEEANVNNLLMSEIKRLTNVVLAGKNEVLPYAVACQRGLLDEDQQSEVENVLIYFTLVSWIRLPDAMSSGMGMEGLKQLWRAQTTSSDATAFLASLLTSTPVENTGEKPQTTPAVFPLSTAA